MRSPKQPEQRRQERQRRDHRHDADEDGAEREAAHDVVRHDHHPAHRDDERRPADQNRAACRRAGARDRVGLLTAGPALLSVPRHDEQRVVDAEREPHPREHVEDEHREVERLRQDRDEAEGDDDRDDGHQQRHEAGDDGAEDEDQDDERCG